jgi:hypothetical protein
MKLVKSITPIFYNEYGYEVVVSESVMELDEVWQAGDIFPSYREVPRVREQRFIVDEEAVKYWIELYNSQQD